MHADTEALTWTHTSTLKKLTLSKAAERFFCTGCGTPVSMMYHFEKGMTGLTAATIDSESLDALQLKVEQHIFLKEKAPWVIIPDDGAERWQESMFAQQLASLSV